MRNRLYVFAVLTFLLSPGFPAGRAQGDTFTYARQERQVRAGILVSRATQLENPDPHVFYVLDARADLKPPGMEFTNPLAPPVLTADIYARWRQRVRGGAYDPAFDAANALSRVFQVGAKVTKNMGAYWEVNLDNLTTEDLRQFDLLYLHSHIPNVAFPAEEREKLRKFVEGGGTLWIENCGGLSFSRNAPFLLDVNMNNGGNPASQAVIATPNHPLLTYPYVLTPNEIATFGDKGINDYYMYMPATPADPAPGQNAVNPPGQQSLVPVVWNTRGQGSPGWFAPNPAWRPYILAGNVGAGRLVFCAQDSGCAINDYIGGGNAGYGGNSAAVSGETLIGAHPADLKFAYNLATWHSAHATPQTDVRRSGGTNETVGAKLVDKWTAPTTAINFPVGSAALYKYGVFVVDTNLVLHAYDANPSQDLDGDQNPDDGVQDFIAGAGYDELWRLDLKGIASGAVAASTPTIVEFYDPNSQGAAGGFANFGHRTLVVVVLSDGTVVAARAFPRLAAPNFPLAPTPVVDWTRKLPDAQEFYPSANAYQTQPVPSAAWSEGVLFVSANTTNGGRIIAIDPHNGTSAFDLSDAIATGKGAIPEAPGTPSITSSPTVGYVHDNATGANDKVVYVRVEAGGGLGAAVPPSVRAYWFGAKAESLRRIGGDIFESRSRIPWYNTLEAGRTSPNLMLRPRLFWSLTGQPPRELTLTTTDPPGDNEFTILAPVANQNQRIKIGTVNGAAANRDDANAVFQADYTLDWSPVNIAVTARVNTRTGGALAAPNVPSRTASVGGAPVLSPDDILYYTVSNPEADLANPVNSGRGIVYAVNEQEGTGRAGTGTMLKWTYVMHDGVQMPVNGQPVTIPPRLRYTQPLFPGDPAVGQFIYNVQFLHSPAYRNGILYAVGTGNVGSPTGTPVSVLCAFRANPEFRLRLNQRIEPGTPLRIRQLNVVTSQGLQAGGALAQPQWVELNQQQYTVDRESGLVRITSFAAPGTVQGFASASLPFVVQIGNGPETLFAGTQVDNVGGATEPHLIAPEGIDNLLWYAIFPAGQLPGTGRQVGVVSSSPSIQGNLMWLGSTGGFFASLDADPAATDPSVQKGSQIRLINATDLSFVHLRWVEDMGAQPILGPPIGAANLLAVNSAFGLKTFEETYTLIADGNRLVEVNSAGEPMWTATGSRTYDVAGGELPQFLVDPNTGNVTPANPANSSGVPVVHKVPFARPAVVRRIGVNDMIVVDTGNNRVLQMDRGGNVKWEVNRLFDDMKRVMRPGDPLSLNEPTDCSYWTEFNPAAVIGGFSGPAWIVHYLIADTGNFRVVELVDVYDAAGRPVTTNLGAGNVTLLRQVNFVSSTYSTSDKRYRYRTVDRVQMRNGDLPANWQFNPADPNTNLPADTIRQLTLTLVSNIRLVGDQSRPWLTVNRLGEKVESGGGSIVILNEAGNPLSIVSNLRIPDPTAPGGFRIQPINAPTWFSRFSEVVPGAGGAPTVVFKYLLCDANGCYQLTTGTDANGMPLMTAEWMLSAQDYFWMTGKRLVATSIRRLSAPGGNTPVAGLTPALRQFLIANRFSGAQDVRTSFGVNYPTNEFQGEVFILRPTTFRWDQPFHGYQRDYNVAGGVLTRNGGSSITWRVPDERLPLIPGLIRRFIGSTERGTSTSILEQPAFADRPF